MAGSVDATKSSDASHQKFMQSLPSEDLRKLYAEATPATAVKRFLKDTEHDGEWQPTSGRLNPR